MGYRVAVVHQGFIPLYRKGLFEGLNATGNAYVIYHGDPLRGSSLVALGEPIRFPNVKVRNREIRIGGRALVWQPIVGSVLRGGYDAIVIGHEIKFLASMVLFALFKLTGKPVVLWGHGYHRSGTSRLARWSSAALARAADGYLAYTAMSAARLREAGVPLSHTAVVWNTINMSEHERAYEETLHADPAALRTSLGLAPDAGTFVYIGRLDERKKVADLIEAARLANEAGGRPVEAVIIGDGPERPALEKQAAGLPFVHFTGPIYEAAPLARYMRVALAVVIPGAVGLAANQAFAYALPLVTQPSPLHGPEIDYIEHGRNGLMVSGGVRELAAALRQLVEDEPLRARLSAGALASRADLSVDKAVHAFDAAVCAAIERRAAGRRPRARKEIRSP